jgi:hypothetical protein
VEGDSQTPDTTGPDHRENFQTLDTTGPDCWGWLADAGYYRARSLNEVTPRIWILQVLFVGDNFRTLDTTGPDCWGWLADAGYYRARSLNGVTPRIWILQVLFVGDAKVAKTLLHWGEIW